MLRGGISTCRPTVEVSQVKRDGSAGRFCGVMIGFEKSSINFSIMNVERGSLDEGVFEN